MGQNRKRSDNAGFSLLEVILAMAVLALISIPLMNYFTESMRYSVKMRTKQEATIFAQQMVENMKAQEKPLIRIPDGETEYTVPYLTDASMGFSVLESDLNDSATANGIGTGNITLSKTDTDYDIIVKLSTEVSANDLERPLIYGIDDTVDALAVERTQTQEALAYFQAVNASYAAENAGVLLSKEQIQRKMNRRIQVTLGRTDGKDTVSIVYAYDCSGLRDASSSDSFTASQLLNVSFLGLQHIYLLYDKVSELDETGSAKGDTVILSRTADVPVDFAPEIYLICQNPANRGDYEVRVGGLTAGQKVHTNICRAPSGGMSTGRVTDESGNVIHTEPLTESEKTVRIVSVQVKIYPKNHTAEDAPYVEIETTKGE